MNDSFLCIENLVYVSDNYFSNREISKYLGTYGPQNLESASEAIEFFRNRFKNGKTIRWAIVPKSVGKMVGTFSYEYFDNNTLSTIEM